MVFSSEKREAFFIIKDDVKSKSDSVSLEDSEDKESEKIEITYRKSFDSLLGSSVQSKEDMKNTYPLEEVSLGSEISVMGEDVEYVIKIEDLSVSSNQKGSYNIKIVYVLSKYNVIEMKAEAKG